MSVESYCFRKISLPHHSHEAVITEIAREIAEGDETISTTIFGADYQNPTHYLVDIEAVQRHNAGVAADLDSSTELMAADQIDENGRKSAAMIYWGIVFSDCITAYLNYIETLPDGSGLPIGLGFGLGLGGSSLNNCIIIRDLYEEIFYRLPEAIAQARERREIADTFYTHAIDDETGTPIKYFGSVNRVTEQGAPCTHTYRYCIRSGVASSYDDYSTIRIIEPCSGSVVAQVATSADPVDGHLRFVCPESGVTVHLVAYYEDYEYDRENIDSIDADNPDAIRGRHLLNLACQECHLIADEYYTAFEDLGAILESRLRSAADHVIRSYLIDCLETRGYFTAASREFGNSYYDYRSGVDRSGVAFQFNKDPDVSEEGFSYPVKVILFE